MDGARADEAVASTRQAFEQAPVAEDLLDGNDLLEASEVQMPRNHERGERSVPD